MADQLGPPDRDALPSGRRPEADLGQQISEVRGSGSIAIGGGAGPGISGRISVVGKRALDDTTLTADAVLTKLQATYMAGLRRCYKAALATDPTLRGKLVLAFTVTEAGRAVDAKATGVTGACIGELMPSWRFPRPKTKDGEATTARFELDLSLTPE